MTSPLPPRYACSPCMKKGKPRKLVAGRWMYGKWWCHDCVKEYVAKQKGASHG